MISATSGAPPSKVNALREQGVGGKASNDQHAEFCYPSAQSVKGRVLADLLDGLRLTHMDVWERHGSSRAAHHVLMLRKAGWPVVTNEVEVPTSDGRRALIAEYSLPPETIEAAGELGRRFVSEARAARSAS